jgi:hypothetical protein
VRVRKESFFIALVFVLRGAKFLCAGQFPGQVCRLVDQHRQALRTNEDFIRAITHYHQRHFLLGAVTIQANGFNHQVSFGHRLGHGRSQ